MTILVTGATANIGRRIVGHLIDLGANDIRALTKDPAKADLPDSVQPITGYLGDPESLPAALDGVDRMYLAPLPKTLDDTLELAKKAGVEYVVALSGAAHWQQHADAVAASGLVNTQLGPGEFLENFAIWAEQVKATRTVSDGRRIPDLDGRHRPGGCGAAGQGRRITLRPDVSDHRS
jgi:NAD(P)-dependent dehydrogenase (short-subunit alcohol dehydrogenase family)